MLQHKVAVQPIGDAPLRLLGKSVRRATDGRDEHTEEQRAAGQVLTSFKFGNQVQGSFCKKHLYLTRWTTPTGTPSARARSATTRVDCKQSERPKPGSTVQYSNYRGKTAGTPLPHTYDRSDTTSDRSSSVSELAAPPGCKLQASAPRRASMRCRPSAPLSMWSGAWPCTSRSQPFQALIKTLPGRFTDLGMSRL